MRALALFFLLGTKSIAFENYIHYPPVIRPVPTSFLELQVLEGDFKLDNSNIEKAIIAIDENGQYLGLEITVKPDFIKDLEKLTEQAVNKKINLVIDKHIVAVSIIPQALGRKFLLSSLPKVEALKFIDTLDYFKNHQPS